MNIATHSTHIHSTMDCHAATSVKIVLEFLQSSVAAPAAVEAVSLLQPQPVQVSHIQLRMGKNQIP
jgi:hypothetical protein